MPKKPTKNKKKKHAQGEGRSAKENTPLLQDCLSWKSVFPRISEFVVCDPWTSSLWLVLLGL